MKFTHLALLSTLITPAVFAAPLTIDTYNPQDKGMFAVSSTLVSGPKEAVLFDAQFNVKDGEALVDKIRKIGKTLNKIVITSGDPDFYFGLQPLVKAFPNAKVVATQQVVDHIKATKDAKLAFWGPQMKNGAPTELIVPQVLASTTFMVDGEKIDIEQPESYAAYVWIPSAKTILGGTGVAWGIHVWTADTQTPASRKEWQQTLESMAAHKPERVIPGHYLGTPPAGSGAIDFTRDYLQRFEQALSEHKTSTGVINAMKKQYPGLAEESSLELSAKVNTGEMKW
ncbi:MULTISPECIES: Vmh family MBL fold metallo-hydrolase [Enterobacter]|uniref:Vmh family MBL fold metallo-hydrolase n=1 Tax=Enterobacter cloacae TaxID=550 RepID=A0AA42QZF0_ENTCL|nr:MULTISPECIES: Vmh family MBL fold metallo-hydrolase [Enterobacter]HAS0834850.1 MBL fold metallo-hydrolase [Enterobacter cloacae subsp. cloacae]EKY1503393.1 MBL fold metallo-hydrolase [Enterobacter cloacae]MDH0438718.1 Vmh family MBL fold metallo-hydrolase [Enterobacter cloacae]MDH1480782.1 Vmh family MBL fold metallo-hydrolase [Enterobacter cloacae]NWJ82834.1 MBL fold metallo-hydrolase [Enterobacter sp. SECR19-1250]